MTTPMKLLLGLIAPALLLSVFWISMVPAVPESTIAYLERVCNESGAGGIKGDLPVRADGYLVTMQPWGVSNPLLLVENFTQKGFKFIEYSREVLISPKRFLRDGSSTASSSGQLEAKYLRVSYATTGDPACEKFETYKQARRRVPAERCLALEPVFDDADLKSKIELLVFGELDNLGPVPIRWARYEVRDRASRQSLVNLNMFLYCASEIESSVTRGFSGCAGHSEANPQLFACPGSITEMRENGITFLERVIASSPRSE